MTPPNEAIGLGAAWTLTGALWAVALSVAAHALDSPLPPTALVTCILGFMALGALSRATERRHAATLPTIPDSRGRPRRPTHPALWVLPALLSLAPLVLIGAALSLRAGSLVPLALFGTGAVALGLWGMRWWADSALHAALRALGDDDAAAASHQLGLLTGRWWLPTRTRRAAELHLGQLALLGARPQQAIAHFQRVPAGPGAPEARAGLALAHLLADDPAASEAALQRALTEPHLGQTAEQLDVVRLLLLLREGRDADAARLGGELVDDDAGALLHALVQLARRRCGLPTDDPSESLRALRAAGWCALLPELEELGVADR